MFGAYEDTKSRFWRGMEAFVLFRMLPLKSVSVTVSDNVSWLVNRGRLKGTDSDLVKRWTAAQKIQFAREWEEKLVDPDSAATIATEEDALELAARESSEKIWAKSLAVKERIASHYQDEADRAAACVDEAKLDPARITPYMRSSIKKLIKWRKPIAKNTRAVAACAMEALEKFKADLPLRIEEEAAMRKVDREARIRRQVSIMPKARASTKSTVS